EAVGAAEAERKAKAAEIVQRRRAEEGRDRLLQFLDQMTSEITGDSLATQRHLSPEQKRFLREVLTYFREVAMEVADDKDARERRAKAAIRVGTIEDRLGHREESAAALSQARAEYERLAAEFPAVPEYRLDLAKGHNGLAWQLTQLHKREQALVSY